MLRRLSGILAWTLILNLSVEAADRACATHGKEPQANAADAHRGHTKAPTQGEREHHSDDHSSPSHDGGDEDCKIPTTARCCQAAASCGITLSSAAMDISNAPRDNARAIADPLSHALKGSLAPDTPPPKA